MPEVRYDDRSFVVNGDRIWLASGSVHYFRIPSALWADRLLKAKRAGLNCISTYVPWNFHEPTEGNWQFSGDQDVVQFVRLAGELGLYVILRPGPYICAEWDFGGLPAWLTTKTGIAYRTSNASYMHYFDKLFANVLPRLAEQQVTRGGNIILIQNENEYANTTMPERRNYLNFITQLFRRAGFEIPIINCNLLSDPPAEESVECVNGWNGLVQKLSRLRLRQPDAPLLVTEFWTGWLDAWGGQHETHAPREVARRALEILGCGSQYNYYIWAGGTNFAFWGSRLDGPEGRFQTTSYDYDAPLAEGGGLTEKYYQTRLVNMFASQMGPFLAGCRGQGPSVRISDSTDVLNISGANGQWAVVTNNGNDEITTATISLTTGRRLRVSLEPLGAVAIPVEVELGPKTRLDYANCMPLGVFGQNVLVFHAPPQWEAVVSVNGKELRATVPKTDQPEIREHESLRIIFVNSDLARRTWWVEGKLFFGPDFVGQTVDDTVDHPRTRQYTLLDEEGQIKRPKPKAGAGQSRKPTTPRLGTWKRISVCHEPGGGELDWGRVNRPQTVDEVGVHYGYLWYKLSISEQRARNRCLFLPECEDRATLFLNGRRLGIWGRGPDATRVPIRAAMKRGENDLTVLVDNLGRVCYGPHLGERKGLYGHVFDAKAMRPRTFKLKPAEGFSRRVVPRMFAYLLGELDASPVWQATAEFTLTKVTPVHLSFSDLPHHLAVMCNNRTAGFFPASGSPRSSFGEVTLGGELKKGRNTVSLLLWGDVGKQVLSKFTFHMLRESLTDQSAWSVRPWRIPEPQKRTTGRKGYPAWYAARFRWTPTSVPLFVRIAGAKKGQLFLNNRPVGRFWTMGPQEWYYLPESWLEPTNELLLFEEHGLAPRNCRLQFRPQGPYR